MQPALSPHTHSSRHARQNTHTDTHEHPYAGHDEDGTASLVPSSPATAGRRAPNPSAAHTNSCTWSRLAGP
ncbi:hypothetical protein K431DRAFT_285630 [Polychaeton citri CBS 116435]|uniref:Uncharacterized protein n=1 Tax=Polychaeton citri CBS 116435 TaxID=1314669 RepID=A0A9P4Q524_9PEZI|nr:hypothetical protein K431DRAFT_285630 [Polychaeton citri CBS 116435]